MIVDMEVGLCQPRIPDCIYPAGLFHHWTTYLLNTLRCHFLDNIFKCIFVNENIWIPIKISLKFVPKGPIHNFPALGQMMAWRRTGDKPYHLNQWWLVHWRIYIYIIYIYESLGLNELKSVHLEDGWSIKITYWDPSCLLFTHLYEKQTEKPNILHWCQYTLSDPCYCWFSSSSSSSSSSSQ